MTYIRAWMSLIFGQIRLPVSMATDRVIMAKMVSPLFLGCFSSDPFISPPTVEPSSVCLSGCVSVNIFKLEYLCKQWANCNEIYLNHHWGGGKAAFGFGPDRIRTLVSMATDSSHRVIMEKML